MNADTYGTLIISIFVVRHNDAHQGSVRKLTSIRCQFGEAETIWKAWLENNTTLKAGYNIPVAAEFKPHSMPIS